MPTSFSGAIPACSGRPYRNQYHFLMVIRDGKVRQLKEYLDTMHAQEVLVEGAAALES